MGAGKKRERKSGDAVGKNHKTEREERVGGQSHKKWV